MKRFLERVKCSNLKGLLCDLAVFIAVSVVILYFCPSQESRYRLKYIALNTAVFTAVTFLLRIFRGVYQHHDNSLKRQGEIMFRLITADLISCAAIFAIEQILPPVARIKFVHMFCVIAMNTLISLCYRVFVFTLHEKNYYDDY